MKTLLHVGCGFQNKSGLKGFATDDWREIRFDIDPTVNPDLVGSLTDMHAVVSGCVDAIYSSHNLEHLYWHEVHVALREFYRVLKDDGFVILTCPDLLSVCAAVANDKLLETAYVSPSGPIAPIDILYGHRDLIARGRFYMAHKTGFTYATLNKALFEAGFRFNLGAARPAAYDLWFASFKQHKSNENGMEIAMAYLP